jgi:hypothetical protein
MLTARAISRGIAVGGCKQGDGCFNYLLSRLERRIDAGNPCIRLRYHQCSLQSDQEVKMPV